VEVAANGYRQCGVPRPERGAILIVVDEPCLTAAAADQLEDVGFSTRMVTDGSRPCGFSPRHPRAL